VGPLIPVTVPLIYMYQTSKPTPASWKRHVKLNAHTTLIGLYGYPVAHSLSPVLHNAALAELDLPYCYLAFSVAPAGLVTAIRALPILGLGGVNLTVPHKQRALDLVDRVTTEAADIGAINTIHNRNGTLIGHNTDASGFLESLLHDGFFDPNGAHVVILGAGGAARAIAYALLRGGADRIVIANRTLSRARALVRDLGALTGAADVLRAIVLPSEALRNTLRHTDLLVNATTLGLRSHDPSPCPAEWLKPSTFCYDAIYHHRTAFLEAARKRHLPALDGLGMLVRQAAKSLEIWTGRRPPREVMFRAARCTLRHSEIRHSEN